MRTKLKSYISNFYQNKPDYDKNIELKEYHSYRVADYAKKISNGEETKLAEIAGLLHDIGRFKQFEKYNSFVDFKTEDHGDLGAKVLEDENFICEFSLEEQFTILHAVKFHNKKELHLCNNDLANDLLKIVRDADKLDIFNVIKHHITSQNRNPIIEQGLSHKPKVSDFVLNEFLNHRTIKRTDIFTIDEGKIGLLSWIYDMNFKESHRILKNENVLQIIANSITNPKTKEVVISKIADYIVV